MEKIIHFILFCTHCMASCGLYYAVCVAHIHILNNLCREVIGLMSLSLSDDPIFLKL